MTNCAQGVIIPTRSKTIKREERRCHGFLVARLLLAERDLSSLYGVCM